MLMPSGLAIALGLQCLLEMTGLQDYMVQLLLMSGP